MLAWEKAIAKLLQLLRLDEIKKKILVFSLLATLIPSLTMGWLSYVHNTQVLTEKVSEGLRSVTKHTSRELDLWIKQRLYEVRVFSSSYEVSENLDKIAHGRGRGQALRRLNEYLGSVRGKFADYEELLVIDPKGNVISTSAQQVGLVNLPPNWLKQARADHPITGNAYWDDRLNIAAMNIAVPIKAADGRFLGALTAKLNFGTIEDVMKSFPLGKTGRVYLLNPDGSLIISSKESSSALMQTKVPDLIVQAMFEEEALPLEYSNQDAETVLGTVKQASQLDWGVLAEIGRKEAYAQTTRIRNLTLQIALGLLLVIGLTAYLLGVTIVRPLHRLAKGAEQVATGNLDVDVPVVSGGEVGYLTQVFNYMVGRLRQGQEELAAINNTLMMKNRELEELSITDGLTGLYNRRYMMDTLTNEVARAQRLERHFSVLMIDIDYFKKYNDTYGHLAGDDLLMKAGSVFRETIRSMDYAARYGGEEFLIMLPEHGADGAVEVAERIRTKVASETSSDEYRKTPVTVSIGVAVFPENGATPAALIASADAALYQGKQRGRNRVVLSDVTPTEQTAGGRRSPSAERHRRS